MAGPLRRVSQNYNWTIKRAHNDLHNSITSGPPPSPAPSPDVETVLPWDSPVLQWKLKSEYDELREHLRRSLLILFGWCLTIGHLVEQFVVSVLEFRISSSQTPVPIPKTDQAISQLYKQSAKPPIRDTLSVSVRGLLTQLFPIPFPKAQPDQPVSHLYRQGAELSIRSMITVWGLFAPLFQYAVPRIAFPTQPFFSRSANGFGADKREELDANPTSSHSTRPPLPDEQPDPSPNIESTASERPEDSPTITVMSDPAHSTLEESFMDAQKDCSERLQSAVHMGKGMLFYGSPTLDGDIGKPHNAFKTTLDPTNGNTSGLGSAHFFQTSPNPTQRQGEFRVIITRPPTDDGPAFVD
ncbi:hypothetical protein EDB86DRAFT_2895224 [Lactarius hatsudake]|nr:hypothetical protein EDB86DRAFT_2895224 [Lactarius hatsudake]